MSFTLENAQEGWCSFSVWQSFPSREKKVEGKIASSLIYVTKIRWVYTQGKVLQGLQDAETKKAQSFFLGAHSLARDSDMLSNYDAKWWVL